MPRPNPTPNRKKKKVTAEMFREGDYKLSLTSWLAGGAPLVPKSGGYWSYKNAKPTPKVASPLTTAANAGAAVEPRIGTDSGSLADNIEVLTVSDSEDTSGHEQAESDGSTESESDDAAGSDLCVKNVEGGEANSVSLEKTKSRQYNHRHHRRKEPLVCLKKKDGKTKCLKKIRRIELLYDSESSSSSSSSSPLPRRKAKKKKNKKSSKIKKEPNQPSPSRNSSEDAATQTDSAPEDTTTVPSGSEATSGGGAAAENGDSDHWTMSQDAIVLSMREGGETWADIGKAIACTEDDVQRRWEELTAGDKGSKEKRKHKNKNGKEKRSTNGADNGATTYQPPYGQHLGLGAGPLGFSYGDGGRISAHIIPDANFSPTDCEILRLVDSRHKIDRWLELQSGFFNATGRMVSLDVLKYKMGKDN